MSRDMFLNFYFELVYVYYDICTSNYMVCRVIILLYYIARGKFE